MLHACKLTIRTAGLLLLFFFNLGCQKEVGAGPMAPDFSLADLSGNMMTLKQHRGCIVLLDFWATWCGPCRFSIPELTKLQGKYKDRGLVILGISLDDPRQFPNTYLQAFKQKFGINYTILRFNNRVARAYFGTSNIAIPTLFVIDREGRIRDKIVGFRPAAVEKSLAEVLE